MTETPLKGLRVLDAATLFAGPLAATMLGDFGAEVVKIEHPTKPDPSVATAPRRTASACGGSCWAATSETSPSTCRSRADVAPSSSWPGRRTSSSRTSVPAPWRSGTSAGRSCTAVNPRLVLARVTAFGQFGPYSRRPGFGTLAEAMSGFAAITGEPDAPPVLPPFGLADSIAGLARCCLSVPELSGRRGAVRRPRLL
ncbi:CoA transferase OS=Streptomyces alboniger OX=132473 GN=CP975_08855 PE=4 SV=1 [Streptomyces alboniger]